MKFSHGFLVVIYIKLAKVIFDKKFCQLAITNLNIKRKSANIKFMLTDFKGIIEYWVKQFQQVAIT